jgi:hypothetical protein
MSKSAIFSSFILFASHAVSNAALITQQTTDDGIWPSLPSGYYPHQNTSGVNGYYDAFSVTISGIPGQSIDSLQFGFSFQGLFDDSIAFDLNSDGQIDWTGDYFDIAQAFSSYYPWAQLNDALNTKVYLTIGPTGSSVTLKVYDQVVTQGVGTHPETDLVNDIGAFTLSSLGLPATFPGSGVVSMTDPIRVGFVNTAGAGSGVPSIDTSSFFGGSTSPVPETSSALGTLALISIGMAFRRRCR